MWAHGGLPHVKRASNFGVGVTRADHGVNPADPRVREASVGFFEQISRSSGSSPGARRDPSLSAFFGDTA